MGAFAKKGRRARHLLIAKADEYQDAFLDLPRHIGIIGPVIDYDHRDYFGPGRPVTESFAADLDLVIADADNPAARAARTVISVGTSPDAEYRITNINPTEVAGGSNTGTGTPSSTCTRRTGARHCT